MHDYTQFYWFVHCFFNHICSCRQIEAVLSTAFRRDNLHVGIYWYMVQPCSFHRIVLQSYHNIINTQNRAHFYNILFSVSEKEGKCGEGGRRREKEREGGREGERERLRLNTFTSSMVCLLCWTRVVWWGHGYRTCDNCTGSMTGTNHQNTVRQKATQHKTSEVGGRSRLLTDTPTSSQAYT